MDAGKVSLTHAAGVCLDAIVAALGAAVLSLSFLETVDLLVKILVGIATLILILLRIRAHLRAKAAPGGKLLGAVIGAVLFCSSGSAAGAPPPNADPALGPWFRSLTTPGGMSCCAEYDGHVLGDGDWRINGDHYEVRIAQVWRVVPSEAVLNRVDNPTGGAVAFYAPTADADPSVPTKIFCFVRPVES